ncbi:hypothetical protein [Burkholderia phage FLC9]|nr:hypothetical protein [Burkholderia phage FLC9]
MNTAIALNPEAQAAEAQVVEQPQSKLEANLVEYVSDRLAEQGHPAPQKWTGGLHPDALTTTDFSIHRFLVNRQLRLVLGNLDTNTTQERFCLVDGGTAEDWKRLFEDKVLPCMIKNAPRSETVN